MSDTRFWPLVATMGPRLDVDRLRVRLRTFGTTDLDAFCCRLDQAMAALNTSAHRAEAAYAFEIARQPGVHRSWSTPELACPVSFDELRATIVAHGRDAWAAMVAEPALVPGGWPTGLGRQLLDTVARALRATLPQHEPV